VRPLTRFAAAVLSATPLLAAASSSAPAQEAFVPLFNGRDLAGWVSVNCAPGTWSVRDGMIHSTGKPICELRTERMYQNFVLELEYKHLEPGGNAGVFIWGDALTARGQPFVRAIEVQVLDGRNTANYTSHGDVFAIHGARMTPERPHPAGWARSLPSEQRARPAGEWNHYRITARDGTIALEVNGKHVSGGHSISPRKGYIHLESEGGAVDWRNLRIAELPGSDVPAADVAQADEGFVSLYNGIDFSGWRHTPAHQPHWASKDWTIAYGGTAPGAASELATEATFGDTVAIVDWRAAEGVQLRELPLGFEGLTLSETARAAVARKLSADGATPPWHRAMLTKKGSRASLTIDGEAIAADLTTGSGPSRLVLRPGASKVEFANVFVKR
jgi:hypothetical protein